MRIVCLIKLNKDNDKIHEVQHKLMKLGYKNLVRYTTRERAEGEVNAVDFHFITRDKFIRLVEKDIIMDWMEYQGEIYGIPHPIGAKNNVVIVELKEYYKIKNIYGEQVVGVCILPDLNKLNKIELGVKLKNIEDAVTDVEIKIDEGLDSDIILSKILKYVLESRY